ncbi:MAG: hypothetical protein AAGM22_16055 [Acidobacteriota bacterium]
MCFKVAVNDLCLMGCYERIGDAESDSDDAIRGQNTAAESLA